MWRRLQTLRNLILMRKSQRRTLNYLESKTRRRKSTSRLSKNRESRKNGCTDFWLHIEFLCLLRWCEINWQMTKRSTSCKEILTYFSWWTESSCVERCRYSSSLWEQQWMLFCILKCLCSQNGHCDDLIQQSSNQLTAWHVIARDEFRCNNVDHLFLV